ncbi:peptidoglycan binding protein CsiV [Marinobacterium sp. AK62]|uniref:Peptidoglycan binding protein CsiV n=1 Tax=Marinobacterium alkalitolerans TaxID=1542925 RepID=A0ABS3ZBJ3_9GAMM|nr:CsiV family protein [Marinobacterium alkalitolerans]MBP0048643.1 peptidoglycan binding protein CsiV [Marinobacterium alkalitolerans]
MKRSIYRGLLAAGLIACSASIQAADLYKVEMVVFANLNSDDGGEYWPDLAPVDTAGSLSLAPWDGYPLQRFEQLPTGDLVLGGDAAALSRSANYALLYHKGWLQPITGPSSSPSIRVNASFEDYELNGTLRIYKQRYLHAQPLLQLNSIALSSGYTPQPAAVEAPDASEGSAEVTTAPVQPHRWQLEQSRRMRSEETHYIDHPKMGILLHVRPVE